MLIKPFGDVIKPEEDPLKKSYTGVVVDNNDPDKLQRVKVSIDLWDGLTTDQLDWVRPKKDVFLGNSPNSGTQNIPEIGSEVRVTFPNGDERDPQYEGMEVNESNKCTLFDEFYPNTYGQKDSVGNYEITNKETKITVHKFASGTTIQADPDGTYTIMSPDGLAYISMNGNGEITLKGSKINIEGTDEVNLSSTKIKINASHDLELNANTTQIISQNSTSIKGSLVDIYASNSVQLKAPAVTAMNFEIMGGPGGSIFDLFSKELYTFSGGVLTGVTKKGGLL